MQIVQIDSCKLKVGEVFILDSVWLEFNLKADKHKHTQSARVIAKNFIAQLVTPGLKVCYFTPLLLTDNSEFFSINPALQYTSAPPQTPFFGNHPLIFSCDLCTSGHVGIR